MNCVLLLVLASAAPSAAPSSAAISSGAPTYHAEQIFPPIERQTHAPGIVECPNGDLLASWYGDQEGPQSDAAVFGARKKRGETDWSTPFILADRHGFPDCNTCMMIDGQKRLWLFWPTIVADSWETCLMNFRVAADYEKEGPPKWDRDGLILLKPENFRDEALKLLGTRKLRPPRGAKGGPDSQKAKLGDPLYQRLGWAPRCKPTVLPSGRILLPFIRTRFPSRSWPSATITAIRGMPASR